MAKFKMQEIVSDTRSRTARFGAGTGAGNNWTDAETGKFVKLAGESRYDLAAAGDEIQGWVAALQFATFDGYTLGTVNSGTYKRATADGLQASAGTGTLAVGDYVLVGTAVAKGTVLAGEPKVVKATDQTIAKNSPFAHRVVDLGTAGTGAVGTVILIEPAR